MRSHILPNVLIDASRQETTLLRTPGTILPVLEEMLSEAAVSLQVDLFSLIHCTDDNPHTGTYPFTESGAALILYCQKD